MPLKIHLRIFGIGAALLAILPLSAEAWTNHAYLTTPALGGQPEYRVEVSAEPLDSFLLKENVKIGELLKAEESWAVANVRAYPPAPQTLDFLSSKEANLRVRFLKALRVNSDLELPLFVMQLPGSPASKRKTLPKSAVSVLSRDFQKNIYVQLEPGEKVSALDVLSTASDEPDYGLDIGLWEDNDTSFGKEYGYGKQPFGNPKLDYGTQAPFHMGFYHESAIIYAAAASFKKTFPEERVHLFRSLAKLAFQTGHPYWGYRFAGWGLHYLQDLTMPYHATIMPGRSTITMLSIPLLDMIGIHGPMSRAVGEVSRAHILIEKLLCQEFHDAFQGHDNAYGMIQALRDTSKDSTYPVYADHFPSQVAARESRAVAGKLSSVLKAIVTDNGLYMQIEKISMEGDYDARKFVAGAPGKDVQQYQRIIENQMRSAGAFSRIYMRSF